MEEAPGSDGHVDETVDVLNFAVLAPAVVTVAGHSSYSFTVDHPVLLGVAPAALDGLGRHVVPNVLVNPEMATAWNREESAVACSSGRIDSHTVCMPAPRWRRMPFTDA